MIRLYQILLTCMLVLLCIQLDARKIVFVLDDSRSMVGDKFSAAVYGIQLALAAASEEDEIYLVQAYQLKKLKRTQSAIKEIEELSMKGQDGFGLLVPIIENSFCREGEEIHILIIGDGIWGYEVEGMKSFDAFKTKWDQFYNNCKPHISAISFQNSTFDTVQKKDLGSFYDGRTSLYNELLSHYPLSHYKDIIVNNYDQAKVELEMVISRTLGAALNNSFQQPDKRTIKATFPLPVKEVVILVQKKGPPQQIPNVVNVKGSGIALGDRFEVSNTNSPQKRAVSLSGHVAHVIALDNKVIPAGTTIQVSFDKDIQKSDVTILPISAVDLPPPSIGGVRIVRKDMDNKTITICDDQKVIQIGLESFKDKSGNEIPLSTLQSCKIFYNSDVGSGLLTSANDKFNASLNLGEKKTILISLRLECEGIADITTPNFTIIRQKCNDPEPPIDLGREVISTPFRLSDLLAKSSDGCIQIYPYIIQDGNQIKVNTKNRQLIVNNLPSSFNAVITDKDDYWLLCLGLKKNCACFVNEDKLELVLDMKSETMDVKSLKRTIEIPVIYNVSFWERCKWFLLSFLIGILLLWYVIAILRKKRFKKGSFVSSKTVFTHLKMERDVNYGNVQELPTNFFKRWLVPIIPERRQYDILFLEATDDKNTVLIKSKCLNRDKMRKNGAPLDHFNDVDEGVQSAGERVSHDDIITYDKGNGRKNYYKFNIPS